MELTIEQSERQKRDLEIITHNILKYADKSPYAILLCGGYGRGEGAWYEDEDGNQTPYNDYDITVISDKVLTNDQYDKLRKKIACEVGITWIDIDWYSPSYMRRLAPTIKNYDLLNASQVVFGKDDILRTYRQIEASRIGEYDVVTLYKTRIWTFLGSWNGKFHDLSGADAMFFRNQMAKAVLAACDVLLVKRKSYTASYEDRVRLIRQIYRTDNKLISLAEWALSEKLHPTFGSIGEKNMENLYWECREIFCHSMDTALGKRWNLFKNPEETKKYFYRHTRYLISNAYNRIFRGSEKVEKLLDVFLIQNYIFWGNVGGDVNSEYLIQASDLLQKWGYIGNEITDWDKLRNLSAYARNNI